MATFAGWESQVLRLIGAPDTKENRAFLDAWQRYEGGTASNNPLNTTRSGYPGETNYNSVGVKNYPTPAIGAQATAQTLQNGFYPHIVAGLKSGNPLSLDAAQNLQVVAELKKWGSVTFAAAWIKGMKGGLATGVDAGDVPGGSAVAGAAGAAKSATEAISSAISAVFDPNNLLRAGEIMLGGIMILGGLFLLAKQVGLSAPPTPALARRGVVDPVEAAYGEGEEAGFRAAARSAGRSEGRKRYIRERSSSQGQTFPETGDDIPY